MPRRRAKRPPEQDAPARSGRAFLAAGTIRNPGERESLSVTLSIGWGQVSLHADTLELGAWSEENVEITPIDATSFAFTAEGDRMIFRPDDVITFTEDLGTRTGVATTQVERREDVPGRRRRRRVMRASDDAPPKPGDAAGAVAPKPAHEAPAPPPKETSPKGGRRSMPDLSIPKASVPKLSLRKTRSPAIDRTGQAEPSDVAGPSLWLRSLDAVRHQGWFSLDRVPVYENQRGQDHDHTWNHRAVATSGLSRHVCTICGKIKLR
jgi:hypothetical protein